MQSRVERERASYNDGLDRELFPKVLSYCRAYSDEWDSVRKRDNAMVFADGRVVLELGSLCWRWWLEENNIYPKILHAINISEKELMRGKNEAKNTIIKPIFHLMDAHRLEFEDNTFDMVFGGSILHHLNLKIVLGEVTRVLKPHGKIVFREPLGINPVFNMIRYLTPRARTVDEQPFRFKELSILRDYFEIELYPFLFFSVPLGVLSRLVFSNPKNLLTYVGSKLDRLLIRIAPPMKYLYLGTLSLGEKYTNGKIIRVPIRFKPNNPT